jgi:uncharacterized protein
VTAPRPRRRPHWSDRTALGVTLGVLGTYATVRHVALPSGIHTATNTAMIGVMGALAAAAGLSRAELGLQRETLGAGVRWGAAAAGLVGLGAGAGALLSNDLFGLAGDRAAGSPGDVWFDVLVRIPVATVAFEELAFRGVVGALFERITTSGRALAATALTFGLWHIGPAWRSADAGALATVAAVVLTVMATAGAGVVFQLLKRRSGSLVAPSLAHWGTNGLTLAIAWLALR